MDYQKHNFRSGQRLYASQLNGMDDAILELAEEMKNACGLSIGTVTTGAQAAASIQDGKLNLVFPVTNMGGGSGISDAAKRYILALFENAAYKTARCRRPTML